MMSIKIRKGTYGYTDAHKKRQILKTFVFFLLPISIFLAGYFTTGTKENYFTIVAVVGCLPACKELVNVFLFWKRHSISEKLYQEISSHTGEMAVAYELVLTTYEKSYPVTALVITKDEVVGFTDTVENIYWKKAEKHIQTVLKNNGFSHIHVHIFRDLKQFLERVDSLALASEEGCMDLSREQSMREVILALSI
jgi:hypothetical protein